MTTHRVGWRLALVVSAMMVVCAPSSVELLGQANASQTEVITIDARAALHPFPHSWERMFGSGRAILSLRDSYRRDLREVKKATGFEYIRFHAIFDDEVGLYNEDEHGNPLYNYSYVDQIYDGLLQNGVRPFVELSFMPEKLASTPSRQAFFYKPFNSPPRDWDRWGDMVGHFAQHLVDRYGIDEVSQWYFEVWNEPNLDFWAGSPKELDYYHLYDISSRAIKSVSPRLRVGGPATAQAAWVDRFIQHCVDGNVPVDFVSTHVYANDTAKDVFGTDEQIPRDQMVYRAVRKVHDQVKASAKPDLPLIFSEYNASYKNEVDVTDSAFMGPWLANTIRQCDGLTDIMSYWAFSDVFEEQGVVKRPFYGGLRLDGCREYSQSGLQRLFVASRTGRPTHQRQLRLCARHPPRGRLAGHRRVELRAPWKRRRPKTYHPFAKRIGEWWDNPNPDRRSPPRLGTSCMGGDGQAGLSQPRAAGESAQGCGTRPAGDSSLTCVPTPPRSNSLLSRKAWH